jgi:hypothetical protein
MVVRGALLVLNAWVKRPGVWFFPERSVMKTVSASAVRRVLFEIVGSAFVLAACSGKAAGPPLQSAAHVDSSGGESQYSLMSGSVSWLTDSNLVALATIVNEAAIRLARAESQQSTDHYEAA